VTAIPYVLDDSTGIAIVRPSAGLFAPRMQGIGTLTYRCHTCGELIPKHWEVLFVDPEAESGWASYIVPPTMAPTMTTHHDWHMAQEG
jgi:hypothetical protein